MCNRKKICFLLLFILFQWIVTSEASEKMILLLSDPNPIILSNLNYLFTSKKLPIQHIKVIGIYHHTEATRFQESRQWAKEQNIQWLQWQEFSQKIEISQAFVKNAWTDEFYKLFQQSDGLLIPGGPDLPPSLYNEKTHLSTIIERPYRHLLETSLAFHLLGSSKNPSFQPFLLEKPKYAVMGICLGMQTINVAAGGTLYQDIPSQVYSTSFVEDILEKIPIHAQHRNYHYCITIHDQIDYGCLHPILLQKNSKLGNHFAQFGVPLVYSTHHQAVKSTGKNIEIWAMSQDGKIIEGISHTQFHNVFAVQFHPEKINIWEPNFGKFRTLDAVENTAQIFLQSKNSVEFHQTLWSLFLECLKESATDRKN